MNPLEHDAARLDEFIRQLAHDPNTPAPAWLDPGMAEFVRMVVFSEQQPAPDVEVQARIWKRVRANHFATILSPRPSINGKPHPSIAMRRKAPVFRLAARPGGVLTVLAAALILIALGLWLLLASPRQIGTSEPTIQRPSATVSTSVPSTEPAVSGMKVPSQPSAYVAWSPRGDRIASVGGSKQDEIALWDRDGHLSKSLKGHSGPIAGLAWSPDGKVLASGGNDRSIRLWTPDGDSSAVLSDHTGRVDSLMWSPDSSTLASASNGDSSIRLWTAQGQPVLTIKGSPSAASSGTRITWSPDGKRLLAHYDNTAELWSLDGTIIASLGAEHTITDVEWGPDSTRIAATTFNKGVLIYTADGKADSTLPDYVIMTKLHWSPNGRFIAVLTVGNTIQIYDAQNHRRIAAIDEPGGEIVDMVFSPDSRMLATGSLNPSTFVKLWDLQGRVLMTSPSAQQNVPGVVGVSWSPDQKAIAAWTPGTLALLPLNESVLAQAARAANATSTLTAATGVPTVTGGTLGSDELDEQPLLIGQMVSATITKQGKGIRYIGKTPNAGKLLILTQSDDFSVGVTHEQVICMDSGGNGGGGGGGGGSGAKGGSPEIIPFVVETCKGQVELVVGSVSGSETGRFTIGAYWLAPTQIPMDQPIQGEIRADAPFKYYTFTGVTGNILTVQLDNPDKTPFRTITGSSILVGANATTTRYILNDGSYSVLILPARKDAWGRFSLTLRQDRPPLLDSKVQSAQIDSDHQAAAFLIKGSDKALTLKAHITSGTGDLQITIFPVSSSNATQPATNTGQQMDRFTVAPNVPSVFKLTTYQGQDYALIVSPTSEGAMVVELSVSAP